jgi:hypothetical protein
MSRMIEREVITADQVKSIYKSQTFPTTGFGVVYNLKPELQDKIKEAFFTFPWEGSALKKEFEKSNEGQFLDELQGFLGCDPQDRCGQRCRVHLRVIPFPEAPRLFLRGAVLFHADGAPCSNSRTCPRPIAPATRHCQNVTLTVPKGQVMALIGPSGAGKSTLIRCINRLVEPTSGKVISTAPTSPLSARGAAQDAPQDGHDLPGIRAGRTPDGDGERAVGRLGYVGFWRSFSANIRKLMSTRPFACSTASACSPWPTSAPTNCPAVSASASASPAP